MNNWIVKLAVLVAVVIGGSVMYGYFTGNKLVTAQAKDVKKVAKQGDKTHVATNTSASRQNKETQSKSAQNGSGNFGASDSGGDLFK